MKSYRLLDFNTVDDLHLVEEQEPQPQRGELLIRVHAVSLNFRDIAMLRDKYPIPHKKGLIPISDGAGEVIAVGAGVEDFKAGDRVMGLFHQRWFGGAMPENVNQNSYGSETDGWLVEKKVISQESVVRIPDGLSYEEAATLPCAALTAWTALTGELAIRPGATVLTQGTGGVSIFALQLAKSLGATVIATTSSAAKAARLRELGADEVINYRDEPQWGQRVRELTGGRGVDLVVEVGGPGSLSQSLKAVRPGGEIASIGFLDAEATGINFFELFGSRSTFRVISVGSREGLRGAVKAIDKTAIKPVIDRVFEFKDAKEAYAYVEAGAHFGKVVIRCLPANSDPRPS